jgi:hypothetical protein
MMNDYSRPRIIRVKIEMELEEGEHFNHNLRTISDDAAVKLATESFIFIVTNDTDINEYVQAKRLKED